MSKKRGRGRPNKFSPAYNRAVAQVIKQHGIKGAQAALAAGVEVKVPQVGKPAKVETLKVSISQPTLGKIAKACKVHLKRGRPPVEKVAEAA